MSTTDLPDFLGGEAAPAPEAQAPAAEPAPQAAPEGQAEGQPRGEDGKFAATPPPAAEPTPAQPDGHAVPLATFLDMRDKLSAAEREAKELREWRQDQEAARQRQAPPDPTEDPAGYQAYRDAQVSMSLYEYGRDISKRFAEMQHGEDTVKAAYEWGVKRCDEDPAFNSKLLASKDPYGIVLAEWKRDQIASKVDPSEYEAYLAWKATQPAGDGGQPPAHQAPSAPPAKPVAPRPSLAAAPSAGSHAAPEARDGEAQFNAMFR